MRLLRTVKAAIKRGTFVVAGFLIIASQLAGVASVLLPQPAAAAGLTLPTCQNGGSYITNCLVLASSNAQSAVTVRDGTNIYPVNAIYLPLSKNVSMYNWQGAAPAPTAVNIGYNDIKSATGWALNSQGCTSTNPSYLSNVYKSVPWLGSPVASDGNTFNVSGNCIDYTQDGGSNTERDIGDGLRGTCPDVNNQNCVSTTTNIAYGGQHDYG